MSKSFALGNGQVFVGLDQFGQVYDFYYPHIGLENHTAGHLVHKIGVFADGSMSWIDDGSWSIDMSGAGESMVTHIVARNEAKRVELIFKDVLYNEKNILIREITIKNLDKNKRQLRLFMNQQFEIYESHRGDSAYYDPLHHVLIHYKGRRVFLINAMHTKAGIDDYSIGLFGIEGKEGTFKDAEDGVLEKNPIEHGFVDSVAGFTFDIKGNDQQTFHYWVCIAKTMEEAYDLNSFVLSKQPQNIIETTQNYWSAWVNKQNLSFYGLDEKVVKQYKKSLHIIRSHIDDRGGIIASCDSDLLKQGRDYYNYIWPRDGAFTSLALNSAGYTHVTKKFFEFCNDIITADGYFLHKYRADKSLGSSWHPWIRDGKVNLPIQEDETALVVYALWQYYMYSKDIEYVERIYNSLIKKAADFMLNYIDEATGLPRPSYDLWEEKYGTTTFTAASVSAALYAASRFAGILGKSKAELTYKTYAEKVKKAIIDNFYGERDGYFYKSIYYEGRKQITDKTLDVSSIYALFAFDILDIKDPKLEKSIKALHSKLEIQTDIGGIARYEGDNYFRADHSLPGNPWVISSLWLAQYYIKRAETDKDMDVPIKWLQWAVDRALPSGVMSEQVHPHTGQQISASPLTWSHAEFVVTVIQYLEKLEELGICKVCYPIT